MIRLESSTIQAKKSGGGTDAARPAVTGRSAIGGIENLRCRVDGQRLLRTAPITIDEMLRHAKPHGLI
jgi:hypothetical protein